MSFLAELFTRTRLIGAIAVLLTVAGLLAARSMPRQEDPSFVQRWGQITVPFPGADAETVERLVIDPIEEELAEVPGIWRIESVARAGVGLVTVILKESIHEVDPHWDDVEDALTDATRSLPAEAGPVDFGIDGSEPASVVLMVTGSEDPLALREAASELKHRLLSVSGVARVDLEGDPGRQVTIELDQSAARRMGLDPRELASLLTQRNSTLPGGTVLVDGRQVVLRPHADLRDLDELRRTPIPIADGAAVPLSAIAKVTLSPIEPAAERVRHQGRRAVGVSVIPQRNLDMVSFGERVRAELDTAIPAVAPLQVEVFSFQPDGVKRRLWALGSSLVLGIVIVALVLLFAMGPRMGMVVSSVVPVVALTTLALYAWGGGVLHQMSVAALVLALGLLVDNAIVVAESVQEKLDRGSTPFDAARESVTELALPLATATGTTVAAFLPMLLSQGGTADFTRAVPTILITALVVSYVFATTLTPMLSALFLRGRPERVDAPRPFVEALARATTRHPWRVLSAVAVVVAISAASSGLVKQRFFPPSDRPQLVTSLMLPEGTHIETTDAVAKRLERALLARQDVVGVSSFVGRAAPRFYYNLNAQPRSPHLAQVVVTAQDKATSTELVAWIRELGRTELLAAQVTVREIQQGPPVGAPVEIRLKGDHLGDLQLAADAVLAELRGSPGAADTRHDLGLGVATLAYVIDDAASARRGLSRSDVSTALLGTTHGLAFSEMRAWDDPVPMVLRTSEGVGRPADELLTTDVSAPGVAPVPLMQLARSSVQWRPSVLRHRDRSRIVTVRSELQPGATFADVLDHARPRIDGLELPAGVQLAYGGEAEGSEEANANMAAALPIGALVLLLSLLLAFQSFRRVGIVLVTVPLAVAGIVPGLLLSGEAFGFMALLGSIALMGIVVNNAIVLVDVIQSRMAEGARRDDAIADAIALRTRPILLTTATTVAGMVPLALSGSSLWPPLAWAMISGLLASTLLTLVVVPALYRVLFADPAPVGGAA